MAMGGPQATFTEKFNLVNAGCNDAVIVSSAAGGGTTLVGPTRINCRALQQLATDCGVVWHVDLNPLRPLAQPTVVVHDATVWHQAKPVETLSGVLDADAVAAWASKIPNLSTSICATEKKRTGSVYVIAISCTGRVPSTCIADVLCSARVVNVWVQSSGLEIWIARETHNCGGLQHLAATNKLRPRTKKSRIVRAQASKRAPRKRRLARHVVKQK